MFEELRDENFLILGEEKISLRLMIKSLKDHLHKKGISKGHKILLVEENSSLFCAYLFAGWELGATIVPLSPLSTHHEIKYFINKIRPALIVYENGKEEFLTNALVGNQEEALILHTSGSSGKPKGVVLGQAALRNKFNTYNSHLPKEELNKTLCILPLNFGHGLISNFLFPLLSGNQVILAPSGKMEIYTRLGEIIDEYGITCFSSVPSILKVASNFGNAPEKKTLKKIFCASSNLDPLTWEKTVSWSGGVRVSNMYGLTELASWVAGDLLEKKLTYEDNHFDLPWESEVKIDETGEIFLKSNSVMNGYFDDLESTAKVLNDGWFKTGDLGAIKNNRLVLMGRADNVINLGGVKIYPEEINQVLRRHQDVQDCYTFGMKIKEGAGDHGIGSLIIPKNQTTFKIESLEEFCKEHLSAYKIPTQFQLSDKMPLNQRGKPDLSAIKNLFQAKRK